MARWATIRGPREVAAWSSLASFFLVVALAALSGKSASFYPYLLGIVSALLGWWSREDSVPILSVMGLGILVVLDLTLHIGVLV